MPQATAAAMALPRRLTRSLESLASSFIAWAFALSTAGLLFHLSRALYLGHFPFASPLTLTPHAPDAEPWGLSYLGVRGAYCAGGEALCTLLALGMSMTLSAPIRRLGLLALIAWPGLWAADAILLVASTWHNAWWHTQPWILAATVALLIIVAANLHRAMRLWKLRVAV